MHNAWITMKILRLKTSNLSIWNKQIHCPVLSSEGELNPFFSVIPIYCDINTQLGSYSLALGIPGYYLHITLTDFNKMILKCFVWFKISKIQDWLPQREPRENISISSMQYKCGQAWKSNMNGMTFTDIGQTWRGIGQRWMNTGHSWTYIGQKLTDKLGGHWTTAW